MIIKAQAPPKGITEQSGVIPPGERLAARGNPLFSRKHPHRLGWDKPPSYWISAYPKTQT